MMELPFPEVFSGLPPRLLALPAGSLTVFKALLIKARRLKAPPKARRRMLPHFKALLIKARRLKVPLKARHRRIPHFKALLIKARRLVLANPPKLGLAWQAPGLRSPAAICRPLI